MRHDYSIPQRAEDRWQDMRRSAQEQRLLKQVDEASVAGRKRSRLGARLFAWLLQIGRMASSLTRRAEG